MHRIETQKPRFPARIGLAPLTDGNRSGSRPGVVEQPLAIALAVAQVVEMAVGYLRQTLELGLAVDLKLALENRHGGWPGEGLMGLVDRGQQLDVGPCVARRKAVSAILGYPHLTAGCIAGDQPRNLRPAKTAQLLGFVHADIQSSA